MEIADIALKKAQAIRDTFQAGLLRADTAQRELKALAEETGMFGAITDEEIAANAGKTYQDLTALKDPLAGLSFEEELGQETSQEKEIAPFEQTAADSLTLDYAPNQPRDENGRFTSGGGSDKIGKTKYAPSPRRNSRGVDLNSKEYARITGILNTKYPGLQEGEIRTVYDDKYVYKIEADGYGGFITKKKSKLKSR